MDDILWNLKVKELGEDAFKKVEEIIQKAPEPSEEAKDEDEKK